MSKKVLCRDIHGAEFYVDLEEIKHFRPSVYGVAVNDGKVVLSKQFGDGYDFPGGGMDKGESIEEALVREFKEETGLEVKPIKQLLVHDNVFQTPMDKSIVHSILIYYACEVIGGTLGDVKFDQWEEQYADMPEWIDLAEIDKLKFYNAVESRALIRQVMELK